ncbi:unnamed protein product [Scytosiphon promiscuus]
MVRRTPTKAKATKTGAFPMFLSLLLVVVGIGSNRHLHGGASAQSTSDVDEGFCLGELADCAAETVCTSCVFDFSEGTCSGYTFDAADTCSLLGAAYCCAADASGLTCESDGYTLEYWECALQRSGCSLLDMPCMVGGSSDRGTSGDVGSSVGDPEVISSESDADVANLTSGAVMCGGGLGTFGGVTAALLALATAAVSTVISSSR